MTVNISGTIVGKKCDCDNTGLSPVKPEIKDFNPEEYDNRKR